MAVSTTSFWDWQIVYKYFAEEEVQGALQEVMDLIDRIKGFCEIGALKIEHEGLFYLLVLGSNSTSSYVRKIIEEMEEQARRAILPEELIKKAALQLDLLISDIGEINQDPVYQKLQLNSQN